MGDAFPERFRQEARRCFSTARASLYLGDTLDFLKAQDDRRD